MRAIGTTLGCLLLAGLALLPALGAAGWAPDFVLARNDLGQAVWVLRGQPPAAGIPAAFAPVEAGWFATGPAPNAMRVFYGLAPQPITSVLVDGSAAHSSSGTLWWALAPGSGIVHIALRVGKRTVARSTSAYGIQTNYTGKRASTAERIRVDALSAAAALSDQLAGRAQRAGQSAFAGLTLLGYEVVRSPLPTARRFGLFVPPGSGGCYIGLLLATTSGRAVQGLFAVKENGVAYTPTISGGFHVPLRFTPLTSLPGATEHLFGPEVEVDPGPPRGKGPERAVAGYAFALIHRDASWLRPYVSDAFYRASDPAYFSGLSNPHSEAYQLLTMH